MLQSPKRKGEEEEEENLTNNLDRLLLDAVRGLVYESHEEHTDYDRGRGPKGGTQQRSAKGGGDSNLGSMILVGIVFAAIGYTLGRRSQTSGGMTEDGSSRIQIDTDEAASRTQEMAESTAEKVRETGEQLSERTEAGAEAAAKRIDEGSEEVAAEIDETGSEAADKMEDVDEE